MSEDYDIEGICDAFEDIMDHQVCLISEQANLQTTMCELQKHFHRFATELGKKVA